MAQRGDERRPQLAVFFFSPSLPPSRKKGFKSHGSKLVPRVLSAPRTLLRCLPGHASPFALDLPSPASRKKLEPAATFLNSPVTEKEEGKKRKKKTPEGDAAFRHSPPLHFAVTRAPNSRRCRLHVCCVSRSLNVTYRFSLTKSRESSTRRVPLGPRKRALKKDFPREFMEGSWVLFLFLKKLPALKRQIGSGACLSGLKQVILVDITLSTRSSFLKQRFRRLGR